jgi:hypothetical protein
MISPILAVAGTDVAEHWSFVATIFAAIWATVWAIRQSRQEAVLRRQAQEKEREAQEKEREMERAKLVQREQELRWKQAELAREMLDAIFDYPPSNDAWRMVDDEEDGYKDSQGRPHRINLDLVRKALPKPWGDEHGGPGVYVRWCFDALFYYLEQIERALQLGILRFEDVDAAASYYIALMAKDKNLFEKYAEVIRLKGAAGFMNRFPEWREVKA